MPGRHLHPRSLLVQNGSLVVQHARCSNSEVLSFNSEGKASIQFRFRGRKMCMPEKETMDRVREDRREGKAPSTQAGEFVREEMEHIREGKHGAASAKQAIAIGLSKARRAGVKLQPPEKGETSKATRKQAKRDLKKGARPNKKAPSKTRSRGAKKALKKQPRVAASHRALSRQGHAAARK